MLEPDDQLHRHLAAVPVRTRGPDGARGHRSGRTVTGERMTADAAGSLPAALVSETHTLTSPRARRRTGWEASFAPGLMAILVLAAVARLIVILASPHYVPTNDAADYDHHAVSIATTGHYPASGLGGPTAFRLPGLPVLLAGVDKLVGVGSATTRWEAGRVAEGILGVIVVALIGLIARAGWEARVGLVAAAIAAVYPPLLLTGCSLMSEPLYLALTLGAVLAALAYRASAHRLRYAVLAGVLTGLAALTRGNGIFVLAPIALLVWRGRPLLSRRALRDPLVVVLATVLTLVPWTVRNSIVFHQFVPVGTETGYALAGTYNDAARRDPRAPGLWRAPLAETLALSADRRLNEADISARLIERVEDYVVAHPGYPFVVAFWNSERMLNLPGPGLERMLAPVWDYGRGLAVASVYAFWLAALLAILGAFTRAARRAPAALWVCPLALAGPSVFFLGLTRYRVPADPFVIMLAALALLALTRRRAHTRPD